VSSCSQLVELDALVTGELGASDARALRAHVETCSVCAAEMEMLTAERALFTLRAEALEGLSPPPPLGAVAMPAARASTEKQAWPRFLPALGRIALRGHFTAACAAALFVVASLSRLGTASVSMAISDDVASISGDEGGGSRMFASYREQEPLACSLPGSGIGSRTNSSSGETAPSVTVHDDGAMTSSSSGNAARGELLACVDARTERAIDARTCEPFPQARE